jgi:hypothetical protein
MTAVVPGRIGTILMSMKLFTRSLTMACLCLGIASVLGGASVPGADAEVHGASARGANTDDPVREKRDSETSAAELEREYVELDKAYQSSRRAANDDLDARRKAGEKVDESSAKNVEREYWPQFEELSSKGSGHARLWMALEMQIAFKPRARAVNQNEAAKLLLDVVTNHADEPWVGELSKSLTAFYLLLPEQDVDHIVDVFAEKSHRREAVAEAVYRSATFNKSSKRETAPARVEAMTKLLQHDYADTEFAKKLRGDVPRAVGLGVGNTAPDFTTKDADGVEFKLSDYRGKVVVLDFWGFW